MKTRCAMEALEARALLAASVPSSLVVVSRSETAIGLHWNAPRGPISGFHLLEFDGGALLQNLTLPKGQTSYLATGLTSSRQYSFQLTAFDNGGDSSGTSVVATTIPSLPIAPSNLTQTAAGRSSLTFTWADNSGDATGFLIQRANSFDGFPQTFTTIASLPAAARSYTDRHAIPGAYNAYRVIAVSPDGQSVPPYDGGIPAQTLPLPPANLKLAGVSDTSLQLQWAQDSVYSSTSDFLIQQLIHGRWQTLADQDHFVSAYTVTSLSPNTRYSFRIFATNYFGSSRRPAYIRARTTPSATALSAPSQLRVLASSPTLAMLGFTDSSSGIDHFTIESLDETHAYSSWITDGVMSPSPRGGLISYLATDLLPGVTYQFRVTAVNGHAVSAPSSISFAMPSQPSAKRFTPSGSTMSVTTPSGKVVTAFDEHTWSGPYHQVNTVGISRSNADGSPDASFGTGGRLVLGTYVDSRGDVSLGEILVKPDGSIFAVAGSSVTNISNTGAVLGSATFQFNAPFALTPDGELLVVGYNNEHTNQFTPYLQLFHGDLTPDLSFGNASIVPLPGYNDAFDIEMLSNGTVAIEMSKGHMLLCDLRGQILSYAPSAPINLTAEQFAGHVTLHFTDTSTDETGFVVQVIFGDSGAFFDPYHDSFTLPASPGVGKTVTVDEGTFLSNDNPTFRVYAVKGTYRSAASNFVPVTIPGG